MEYELAGSYPIYRENSVVGTLVVEAEGLYTHFKAQCEPYDGLYRLYILDREAVGCLGIMEPAEGRLHLRRQLTRNSLRGFPCSIMRAELHDGTSQVAPIPPPAAAAVELIAEQSPLSEEIVEVCEESVPQEQSIPPPEKLNAPQDAKPTPPLNFAYAAAAEDVSETSPTTPCVPTNEVDQQQDSDLAPWQPCPLPCSLFSGLEEKRLFGKVRGTLQIKAGSRTLLAVPAAQADIFPRRCPVVFLAKQEIFGETYLVCSVANGKCQN